MSVDLAAAAQFIASHARLLERRRFACIEGDGSAEAVVRALEAYRNADGGIGHLEPDLRTPASQPVCLLYALEVLHEVGADDMSLVRAALDWLPSVTNDDGGLPFFTAGATGWPMAPWFAAGGSESSLLLTSALAGAAYRLGLEHPWLEDAERYCWDHAEEARGAGGYTLRGFLNFLDTVSDRARAEEELEALREWVPADGVVGVSGGNEGETLRALELVPWPDHSARRLFDDAVIERELDRLETEQQDDGGWDFTWAKWNPTAAWEWRGIVTVLALRTLQAYGRLPG